MTGRTVAEWIGSSPDQPFPPRVRLRILERFNRCCANCGQRIIGMFTADHKIALILGGENRESNGQPLCRLCTKQKDASDVADKSKVADIAKAHYGLKTPKHSMRHPTLRKRMDGRVVPRETQER